MLGERCRTRSKNSSLGNFCVFPSGMAEGDPTLLMSNMDMNEKRDNELFLIRGHLVIIQDELGQVMKSRCQSIGRKPVAMRVIQLQ